jgi:hypothetical protein|tara:strand:- start:149 stop:457 length:309 start_codon:yes stop_codon:yes gene_type:complete
MKLTRNQLKGLIAEQVTERRTVLLETPPAPHLQPYENESPEEGHLARQKLYHMAQQAHQLHDMLKAEDDLVPWVQDKITLAADALEKAFKSIVYDKQHPEGR